MEKRDGGEDFTDNGILLRADIHKLFDAKAFTIGHKGKERGIIKKGKSFPAEYKDVIKIGDFIDAGIFEKIKINLRRRNNAISADTSSR